MKSIETILLITLIVVTSFLLCINLFYPPTKDRCMKAAKNEDWCVASVPSNKDGSCLPYP